MVKTLPHFQCRGVGPIPGCATKIPHSPVQMGKNVQTSTSVGFSPFTPAALGAQLTLGAWKLDLRCLESNASFTIQQFFVLGK